jgi:tRNA (cmo5U34)-methyltransferase
MKVDNKINSRQSDWKFDKSVTKNFENHVGKSIPFYEVSHKLTLNISDFFLKNNSQYYDLGCSTGTLMRSMRQRHKTKKIQYIGIDESASMISKAKKFKAENVNFQKEDLNKIKFKKSDLITSLYCIQFLEPKHRQVLFNKIYKSLNWGGGFIMFEKVRGNDARFQDILNFSYFDFKRENKLTPKEIINKELSLRSVMEPYTISANIDFMKRAGFKDIMPISQYLCFVGFLAIK